MTGGPVQTDIAARDEDIQRYVGNPAGFRILGDGKYIPNAAFRRDKALYLRLEARDDEKEAV